MGTGTTILHGKLHFDHRIAAPILDRRPTATRLARRADDAFLLPIHPKLLGGKSGTLARLPMVIIPAGAKEIDPIGLLTGDERFGFHIARIAPVAFLVSNRGAQELRECAQERQDQTEGQTSSQHE
jgi:hypothetical protein